MRIAPWLLLLALLQTGAGAQDTGWTLPPGLVTAAVVEAMIDETESDPGLDGDSKTKLVALYRKALANLERIAASQARADAFAETTRTAPGQTGRIRERIERTQNALEASAPPHLGIAPDAPLDEIERQLQLAQAERDAAGARGAALERRLIYDENRPAAIRLRIAGAEEEQESIAAALQSELAEDASSALVQARRWSLETRYVALSAEIMALDQELLALPMRLDLTAAQRDEESASADGGERRVAALRSLVNDRRESEARNAESDARRMARAAAGKDPALTRLAERNAELTAALADIVERGEGLDADQQRAERLAARTKANFERVKSAKAVGVSSEGLGQLLLEQRAALPDLETYTRRARTLEREIADVNLSRLRHREEAERLADGDPTDAAGGPQDLADELRRSHRDLLEKLLDVETRSLEQLRKLQTTEAGMLEATRAYDAFLEEQLFWLPTGAKTYPTELVKLPEEVAALLGPDRWWELGRALRSEIASSPVFWLSLALAVALTWKRRALIDAIRRTATPLASLSTDRFGCTLEALGLSLAVAAPLPLVLGATGWLVLDAAEGTGLSLALGAYLLRIALILFALLALRAICLPGGLALAHFRWHESDVRRLSSELRWLTWAVVPPIFVLRIALSLNPAAAGGLVTRFGLLIAALALGFFFYRLLHPRHGVLRTQRQRADAGLLYRSYRLWFPMLVVFPAILVALIWSGYIYTTHMLSDAYLVTLGLIAALVLLHALAVRWLTLARRRLAVRAARERRRALIAAREQGASQAAESSELAPDEDIDLDIDAASEDSLQLLRGAVALAAVVGLYLIWSGVFPALGILDEVVLWHSTAIVEGEERYLPITLADLGLALLYLGIAGVLAKRLPALIGMIMAQRFKLASGSRYAIATLTAYAIVAIGVLLALDTIGARWSQLQWLVAALGVGIGFGLQEIVANFISGLIILFERPIRVGDVVTVGSTDGVVTKIRIRATTIRNWDRKELLVPNKELITGQLLNWSLSDEVIRLMVTVGVAYGTDVDKAHALMREAAEEHEHVLKDPKPILTFEGFGDSSLTLILRAYIDDLDYRLATLTDLHKAIDRKFQQAGIAIAFPQRDLHLDAREPLRVSIESRGPGAPQPGGPEQSVSPISSRGTV